MMKKNNLISSWCISILALSGCNKYLNEKSDKSLSTPSTLADLQALLDNTNYVQSNFCGAGEVSTTDYYMSDNDFSALGYEEDKRMYTWQPDNIFFPSSTSLNEWQSCFQAVNICNTVLNELQNIKGANFDSANYVRGQALVWRAFRYWDAAQVWCLSYDSSKASTDLGLPLRLNPDFNLPSVRSDLQTTYEQIIKDLKDAAVILPAVSNNKYRPSKASAYGLLARTYLSIGNYANAFLYADSSLLLQNTLIDYNTLTTTATYPISDLNSEMVLSAAMYSSLPLRTTVAKMDSLLYHSYADNDLRKAAFFRLNTDGSYRFKGSYTGASGGRFVGIATDEMYLIRSECNARTGHLSEALADMNVLLAKRWKTGTFVPMVLPAQKLMDTIIAERRKELVMRGLRWGDIKRLNKEGANILLTRTVNGSIYTLFPNDLRYALPIPEDIIALSGMQQNPR